MGAKGTVRVTDGEEKGVKIEKARWEGTGTMMKIME